MAELSEVSSIAGVLVLIRRLYQEGAVTEEEKGQLKDAILNENNEVNPHSIIFFHSFRRALMSI
jgi:hypothetical protein